MSDEINLIGVTAEGKEVWEFISYWPKRESIGKGSRITELPKQSSEKINEFEEWNLFFTKQSSEKN